MGWWEPSRLLLIVWIPLLILTKICYLPYFLLKPFGKGKWFKRKHFVGVMHLSVFVSEPKEYFKNRKGIQKQAVEESERIVN